MNLCREVSGVWYTKHNLTKRGNQVSTRTLIPRRLGLKGLETGVTNQVPSNLLG